MQNNMLSFNVVNTLTVWVMLFAGLVILALGSSIVLPWLGHGKTANNSGGY